MRDVDFSNLIFVDSSGLMIKSGSPIAKLGDLAGKRVAVIAGTTTEQRLEAALKRTGTAAELVRVREAGEAVALLESGGADAVASDKIKLVGMAALAKSPKALAMLPDDLSFEPYAFALPRGDSALRLEVNRELARIYRSGEIEGIFAKWLGMLGRPSGLLAAMYVLNATPE
jgi:ABC-type amino acid transport substrate-binding protein